MEGGEREDGRRGMDNGTPPAAPKATIIEERRRLSVSSVPSA